MRLKHAILAVGLAGGSSFGTAQAEPIKYIINLEFVDGANTAAVEGFITTDGTIGSQLSESNIESFSLTSRGQKAVSLSFSDSELYADEDGNLLYGNHNGISRLDFNSSSDYPVFEIGDAFGTLYAYAVEPNHAPVFTYLDAPFTLGEAELVSSVPLPASAPMFGAAVLALGAVGYGLKRKGKAMA